jgi:hypothetical protein
MISKVSHQCALTLLLAIVTSCIKAKNGDESPVANGPPITAPPDRQREVMFERFILNLNQTISVVRNEYARDDNGFTYFTLPIEAPAGSEEGATFYFKKNPAGNGPEIHIEFSESFETVELYLSSMHSAKAAFIPESPGGQIKALQAFDILKRRADATRDDVLNALALRLEDLAGFFVQKKSPQSKPSPSHFKYHGKDPSGDLCYVKATYDTDGGLLSLVGGYYSSGSMKQEEYRFNHLWQNGWVKSYPSYCRSLSFDGLRGGEWSLSGKFVDVGVRATYTRRKIAVDSQGKISASKTERSRFFGLVSGNECQTTTLTLCKDNIKLTQLTFKGSTLIIPMLSISIKKTVEFECLNLEMVKD